MSTAAIVLIVSLIVFGAIGVPLVWALSLSSICSLVISGQFNVIPLLAQRMFAGGTQYALLAIFFFILAGSVMQYGGLSRRLINFANSLVGHISGGASLVAVIACTFFAAISGSAVATTAAIGGIMYPELIRLGYPKAYSAALPAAAGVLGVIIPPSVLFIIYGNVTSTSPGKLLISGLIPGILGSLALCVLCYFFAKKHHYPRTSGFQAKNIWVTFKDAIWALLLPIIILGGIYLGIFTPTEAAAVAAAYGFLASIFVYKEMPFERVKMVLKESCRTTGNIMILVMSAGMYSYLLTIYQVPAALSNFLVSHVASPLAFELGVIVLLLFLGMFMDVGAVILILAPMLSPVANAFHIDPILFGLIFIFTLAIGQATPPFGTDLFVSGSISGCSVLEIGKKAIPFCLAYVVIILLCVFFPAIATFLPSIMG